MISTDLSDTGHSFYTYMNVPGMKAQTNLLRGQNARIDTQAVLLRAQNQKIDLQNNRLDQQTNLLEADRRSAVILESGNVLDAIAKELKNPLNFLRKLSDPLVGRIISLSKNMKPYKYLESDTLISEAISPERGHLLLALQNAKLSKRTLSKINRGAFFQQAELGGADLRWAKLSFANLRWADLRWAKLFGADLSYAIAYVSQRQVLIDAGVTEEMLNQMTWIDD